MKTYLECFSCLKKQALRAARIATSNVYTINQCEKAIDELLSKLSNTCSPPEIAMNVYNKIYEITGNSDPYQTIKIQNIKKAQSLYLELQKRIDQADDKLLAAIKIATAGNVIDLGARKQCDVINDVTSVIDQDFAINDYEIFKKKLSKCKQVLYLADNAAEAVFDKFLIKELQKSVIFVVRDQPIINDITIKEAKMIGMDKIAKVITSGCGASGTIVDMCSNEFQKIFTEAELIISKGQGNYEALSGSDNPIFFLLKTKCHLISQHIGVKDNSLLFKYK